MPKLSAKAAKVVDNTEATHGGGDFELLAPGKYLGKLTEVSVRDANKHGLAQWSAEFQELHNIEDGELASGRQWLNLTLPSETNTIPASYTNGAEKWEKYQNMLRGRMAAFFESFGYTADSDTDEMIGEWAVITVKVGTIQSGPKQGDKRNEVVDIENPEDLGIDDLVEQVQAESEDNDAF